MAGPYQLTAAQQAWLSNSFMSWLFQIPPFIVPVGDAVNTVRDTTPAAPGDKPTIPTSLLNTKVVVGNLSRCDTTNWTLAGMPLQSVSATAPMRGWVIGSTDYGYQTWPLPTPADGIWVEGHPHARVFPWQDAPGAWDRHWLGVYPDRVVEMIGVDADRFTAEAAVEFTPTGQIVRSWPVGTLGVCRGNVPMNRYVLTRRSLTEPHVLGMVLPDMADGDGRLDPKLPFPRYNQRVRLRVVPTDLTGDALTVAKMLSTHGARLLDINGVPGRAAIWAQPGVQWIGSNIESLALPLEAFELVP